MDQSPQDPPPPGTRLMDPLREQLRYAHHSLRTEEAYLHWVRAFIRFHDRRHPGDLAQPAGQPGRRHAMGTAATRAATPAAPSTSVRTLREPLPCLAAFRPTLNWSAAATIVS